VLAITSNWVAVIGCVVASGLGVARDPGWGVIAGSVVVGLVGYSGTSVSLVIPVGK